MSNVCQRALLHSRWNPKWGAQRAGIAFRAPAALPAAACGGAATAFGGGKSLTSPLGGVGAPKPTANWGAGKGTPRTGRGTAPGAAKRTESITNDQSLSGPGSGGST